MKHSKYKLLKELKPSQYIICKRLKYGHDCKKDGCWACGGYGIVYEKIKCATCSKWGWSSPGPHSVYDGKHFNTMDGLLMVWHPKTGAICIYCEEGE